MRTACRLSLCLGLCAGLLLAPAWGKPPVTTALHTETGTLQGAPWRIDVPAHWNGELVMYAHGFEPIGTPRPDPWPGNPWTEALGKAGYAVAQSGYRSQGWAVKDAVDDLEHLRARFLLQHPGTRRTWIMGFSMGGAVAIATLERLPGHYAGGASLCGANLPGSVLAIETLTSLLAFDYFFPNAAGLPAAGLASAEAASLPQGAMYAPIEAAVQADPDAAAVLARRLELQPRELADTVSLHALVFQQLVARAGGMPVGNLTTVYAGFGDDKAFNAGVRRMAADATAQARLDRDLALSGDLRRPLLLQYNRDDPSVTPRFEPVYPALAARAGAAAQVTTLPPAGTGHCDFTPEQIVEAVVTLGRQSAPTPAAGSTGAAPNP